ncbi:MAG: hypothetical protein QOJ16_691 [Acidobacteriota bacterium]|nr:hypothetical protein [Acidobacteriota bacterium]
MAEKTETIFVIWDREDSEAKFALQALERRPPRGVRILLPDPSRQTGDLLEDILLPGISAADRVLVVLPSEKTSPNSLLFETGLAIAYRKPLAALGWPGSVLSYISSELLEPAGIKLFREPLHASLKEISELRTSLSERLNRVVQAPADSLILNTTEHAALCPTVGQGAAIREELQSARRDLVLLNPLDPTLFKLMPLDRLIWIVTPEIYPKVQVENAAAALAAGFFYVQGLANNPPLELQLLRSRDAAPIRAAQRFEKTFSDLHELAALLPAEDKSEEEAGLVVEKLTIRNFKNIEHLEVDFSEPSSLPGRWACIAGINGAGKSSILQALAMLLLGEKLVPQLGGDRLLRFLRRVGSQRLGSELTAIVRDGGQKRTLYLALSEQGIDRGKLNSHPDYTSMLDVWQRLEKQVLVSYGATRNLSDFQDSRHSDRSLHVRRQMTLFDPLSQVASVDVLLDGGAATAPTQKTLKALLGKVLAGDLAPGLAPSSDRLLFHQGDVDVETIDLPDGFRSTVAWLADLCAAWHQTALPEETASSDPANITGIVLIDEIDLHLHPSLQRSLIPRLREALPKVQFIVTTHSPLVLSSFDRAEIVMLDRASEGGIKTLDRQIFAFSTDQVYDWLMNTPPQSTVLDEKLAEGTDPDLPLYMLQSKDKSEEQAKEELDEIRTLREKLLDPAS